MTLQSRIAKLIDSFHGWNWVYSHDWVGYQYNSVDDVKNVFGSITDANFLYEHHNKCRDATVYMNLGRRFLHFWYWTILPLFGKTKPKYVIGKLPIRTIGATMTAAGEVVYRGKHFPPSAESYWSIFKVVDSLDDVRQQDSCGLNAYVYSLYYWSKYLKAFVVDVLQSTVSTPRHWTKSYEKLKIFALLNGYGDDLVVDETLKIGERIHFRKIDELTNEL